MPLTLTACNRAEYRRATSQSGHRFCEWSPPAHRKARQAVRGIVRHHCASHESTQTPSRQRWTEGRRSPVSLAYTWGYLQGWTPWCFIPAAVGAALLMWLCWRKHILAEAALQGFYVAMAAYGAWASAGAQDWTPRQWSTETHLIAIVVASAATLLVARWLQKHTRSALPTVDAFTTVFSVLATWLMVRNHHANWAYWIAIDAVAIYLYAKRGLPMGAALYAIYLAMAIVGWFSW